ncbi:MAG: UDP-N-acetylmuramoyl-L-alanine--D-glutamate ligase [Acidobacteriaceae bacterium]
MHEVAGKRVLVVGLGKSGIASALFLAGRGARVTASDARAEEQLRSELPRLLDAGISIETGGHGERTFRMQDLIVVSPGVAANQPQLQQAQALGIPIVGEVELASWFLKGRIIAITGSNGKTTTTALCGKLLEKAGFRVQVGGNIGSPVTNLIGDSSADGWSVLEISSFQLETVESFRAQIGAVLNITPDHLDRHRGMANYIAAKARLFENSEPEDFAILNADNQPAADLALTSKAQPWMFSAQREVPIGGFVRNGLIVFRSRLGHEQELLAVSDIPLKGAHNVENVLAAVLAAKAAGCVDEAIRDGVREFRAVEHRLEFVAEHKGVQYFNDSKATNVDATMKALESFPSGIHLILGGKDKDSDYRVLVPLLQQRVLRVYTIGAAAEKVESHLGGSGVDVVRAETLERAIGIISEAALPGEIALLSPACASFDQFQSYEHRGRRFKGLVHQLS